MELSVLSLFPWFITALYAFLYLSVLIALRRQQLPIVILSPDGITVRTLGTQVGLIPWEEISEIRAYNLLYRFVGIVPRDSDGLCRRMGTIRALLLRLNSWVIPLYRLFGVFVAPINIPQEYLPITADELAARIGDYRASAPPPSAQRVQTSVWPPPPMGRDAGRS